MWGQQSRPLSIQRVKNTSENKNLQTSPAHTLHYPAANTRLYIILLTLVMDIYLLFTFDFEIDDQMDLFVTPQNDGSPIWVRYAILYTAEETNHGSIKRTESH